MDASSAKRATVRRSKKTKAIAQSMITPKSMTPSKSKSAALGAVAIVFALAALAAERARKMRDARRDLRRRRTSARSEERRVGKECRSGWWAEQYEERERT